MRYGVAPLIRLEDPERLAEMTASQLASEYNTTVSNIHSITSKYDLEIRLLKSPRKGKNYGKV